MSRKTKIAVEVALFLVLLGGAGFLWARKLGWIGAAAQAEAIEYAAGDGMRAASATANAQTAAMALPDLTETDLVTLPLSEGSSLLGSANFEIREASSRLIQALMNAGGRKVSCPETAPLYGALERMKLRPIGIKPAPEDQLAQMGKDLKARIVIQIETSRIEGGTKATGVAVDTKSGETKGRWEVEVKPGWTNYDSLFDSQAALAPQIAAGLLGLSGPGAFQRGDASDTVSEADRKAALALAEQASALLNPPAMPRMMTALRLANRAIELDPRSVEAYLILALAGYRLADELAATETTAWREVMLRSYAAGETAAVIAPESPYAIYARALGALSLGRMSAGLKQARAAAEAPAASALSRAWANTFMMNWENVPQCPENASPFERNLFEYLRGRGALARDKKRPNSQLEQSLAADGFAPYTISQWGEQADLNEKRIGHTACSIEGSLLTVLECVRLLEENGKGALAREIAGETRRMIPLEEEAAAAAIVSIAAPDALAAPETAALDRHIRAWIARMGGAAAASSMWWREGCFALQILRYAEKQRVRTLDELKAATPLVRGPGGGFDFPPALWLEIAQRPALDGAAASFHDLAFGFGDNDLASGLGTRLLETFPRDLPLLEEWTLYHHTVAFDNSKVDHFMRRMREQDPFYLPMLRRNALFEPDMGKRVKELEKLRCFAPFHYSTLWHIYFYLVSYGDYSEAARYAQILAASYPMDHRFKIDVLRFQAMAENRLIRVEEIEKVRAKIPSGASGYEIKLAECYTNALELDKAASLYETVFASDPPQDMDSYSDAQWIQRLRGEPDKAIAIIEQYVRQDPHSLCTADLLQEIARIELCRGDLKAARVATNRALRIDSWKYTCIYMNARMLWLEGDRKQALSEFERITERYPGDNSYSDLGWAQLAAGDIEAARKSANLDRNNIYPDCVELRAVIERRLGNNEAAEETLNQYAARMSSDAKPQTLLARFFRKTGDYERAIAAAQRAAALSRSDTRYEATLELAFAYLQKGDLELAEAEVKKLLIYSPVNLYFDLLMAQIALRRGKPQEAITALDRALKANDDDAFGILAQAELAQGQYQKALDHARKANAIRLNPNAEYLLAEGDAAQALGKSEEARAAWTRCREVEGPNTVLGREAARRLGL